MSDVIFEIEESDHRQVIKQKALVYEVSLSTWLPGDTMRENHRVLIVCQSAQSAIEIATAHYRDDPQIDQVILRNRAIPVIIAGALRGGLQQ